MRINRLFQIGLFIGSIMLVGFGNRRVDILHKYHVITSSEYRIVHIEKINDKKKGIRRLLVFDIEKKLDGVEPMDYSRMRIFAQDGSLLYEKKDFPGVEIRRTNCLPPNLVQGHETDYFIHSPRQDLFELIFVGWPYINLAGDSLILGLDTESVKEYFHYSHTIDWTELGEGKQAIVTYAYFEATWSKELFRNKIKDEKAFVFNESQQKYTEDPILTDIWLRKQCDWTMKEFFRTRDEYYFLKTVMYLLTLKQKEAALHFYDANIQSIIFLKSNELPTEEKTNLRCYLENSQ